MVFDPSRYSVRERVLDVDGTARAIAPNNPRRVCLVLHAIGLSLPTFSTLPSVVVGDGITLEGGSGPLVIDWGVWGSAVTVEWWAVAPAACRLCVIEVIESVKG